MQRKKVEKNQACVACISKMSSCLLYFKWLRKNDLGDAKAAFPSNSFETSDSVGHDFIAVPMDIGDTNFEQ